MPLEAPGVALDVTAHVGLAQLYVSSAGSHCGPLGDTNPSQPQPPQPALHGSGRQLGAGTALAASSGHLAHARAAVLGPWPVVPWEGPFSQELAFPNPSDIAGAKPLPLAALSSGSIWDIKDEVDGAGRPGPADLSGLLHC